MIRLLVLVSCFTLNSSAIVESSSFWPLWYLLQGLLLVSLFHLLHECVHDTVFVHKLPNKILAQVCGFILFLPPTWFRYFHHAHHRYTNLPEKDPELESAKPSNLIQWSIHVSGFNLWRSQLGLLLGALLKPCSEPYIRIDVRTKVRAEMLAMLAVYTIVVIVSLLIGSSVLLEIWIIPLLLGQPFLRLYLLAEHGDCETGSNMFRNTRTVLTNPIVRWFTWNMPYHTEHHVYPTVPFHQLPKLHRMMQAYLQEVDSGYVAFNARYVRKMSRGN